MIVGDSKKLHKRHFKNVSSEHPKISSLTFATLSYLPILYKQASNAKFNICDGDDTTISDIKTSAYKEKMWHEQSFAQTYPCGPRKQPNSLHSDVSVYYKLYKQCHWYNNPMTYFDSEFSIQNNIRELNCTNHTQFILATALRSVLIELANWSTTLIFPIYHSTKHHPS